MEDLAEVGLLAVEGLLPLRAALGTGEGAVSVSRSVLRDDEKRMGAERWASCAAEALPTSVRRIPAAFAAASASPREAECPPFGIAFGIGIGTVSGL